MLNETRNIALIGMPGCGKSTIGKTLAQSLNRPLSDIDKLIEESAGKSIMRIFAEDGEDTFRQIETRLLGEEAAKSGMVIATGGGVVTRHENLGCLRKNSIVIYLKRELSELITTDRPLSQSKGIETLAKQRLPLYEEWSDCVIDVAENPEKTVARIIEAICLYKGPSAAQAR